MSSVAPTHESATYLHTRVPAAAKPVVFVVNDDEVMLRFIEMAMRRFGYTVRSFKSATAFLGAIDASMPGCVLLQLSSPRLQGLQVLKQLVATGRLQPVVFLCHGGTVHAAVEAMKAGAEDCLETPFDEGGLMRVVQAAIERDRRQRQRRLESEAYAARADLLTPREREVLMHVIAGQLNKQIGARLGTAEKTVKVHRARVMAKMGVRSVAELTRVARALGIQPEI